MAELPVKDDLVDSGTTEAAYQAALGTLYDFIAQICVSTAAPEAIEIAAGSMTPDKTFVKADTESLASTDNLDNILATNVGNKVLFLKSTNASRVITIRHLQGGTGQIYLAAGANLVLDDTSKMIALYYNSTSSRWEELWKNWGLYLPVASDKTAVRTLLALGTAALVDTGVSAGNVPLNSNLGALAYLSALTVASQITDGIITNDKITNATLNLVAKAANATPNTVLSFNASGVPTLLAQSSFTGGTALLGTLTASASAALNFTSMITSDYSSYRLVLEDLRPATDGADLYLQTSTNNGSTYATTAGDYLWSGGTTKIGYATLNHDEETTGSSIQLNHVVQGGVGNLSSEGISGIVDFINPLGTTRKKVFHYKMNFENVSGDPCMTDGDGVRNSTADIDAFRIKFSSGNITSGKGRLYGLKAS